MQIVHGSKAAGLLVFKTVKSKICTLIENSELVDAHSERTNLKSYKIATYALNPLSQFLYANCRQLVPSISPLQDFDNPVTVSPMDVMTNTYISITAHTF